jgi:hypothetical protein
MPENIETSLNWPESGLAGVPDSEGSLTYTAPSHVGNGAAPEAEEDGDGAEDGAEGDDSKSGVAAQGANGTNGANGAHAASPTVPPVAVAVQELTTLLQTARAEGDTETVRAAEESLARIQAATADVRATLEKVQGLISDRGNQFSTQLDFGTNPLSDDDPALFAQSLFGDRPDGFTPGHDATPAPVSAMTWPPFGPTRERSTWSRMVRSNIAVPLLLVAVIAVAAATYKVYKHVTRTTVVPAISDAGISADGSVKVVDGPVCRAGRSTTTVQLAAAQGSNGSYYIGAGGTVANGGSTALHHMDVHVLITYADGAQTTATVPANKGQDIPGKTTKSWFGSAEYTDGSVPPISVAITGVHATPTLPACS